LPATSVNIAVAATHGRGHAPRLVRWVFVCIAVGELGYNVGDELDITGYHGTVQPATWANASQVGFAHAAATWGLAVQNKNGTTQNILTNTATRWALKCYCDW
jgi:hypothetical protein